MAIEKIFFDSSIIISILRGSSGFDKFDRLLNGSFEFVVCKIVLMELWAGVRSTQEGRIITRLQNSFPQIGISDENFILAGQVLSKMRSSLERDSIRMRRSLTWDVLIALSAKENNAAIVTGNLKDFRRIQRHVQFSMLEF